MEHELRINPTFGYIPDISKNNSPGFIDINERQYLRLLAEKVAIASNDPIQAEKRALWLSHNRLEKTRPLVMVFPENAWYEMINPSSLKIADPFWRQIEWELTHLIYRYERLNDDFVVEPFFDAHSTVHISDWGVTTEYTKVDDHGSYCWKPPLKEERDLESLKFPSIKEDEQVTNNIYEVLSDIFSDILPIRRQCGIRLGINIVTTAAFLRGIEQLMIDMYERPEWLHKLLAYITDGYSQMIDYLDSGGYFTLNNGNHYVDTGGLGYSDELPGKNSIDDHVRARDLWTYSAAQEYSWVSPAMHDEFGLMYQEKLLSRFALVSYGCCEPLNKKFDIIKRLPNLRRVSVSPWCDVELATDALKDKYVFSWKPHPASFSIGFDENVIRKDIQQTLQITKGTVLEVILKDTLTVQNDPSRFERWIGIVQEEIDRIYC